MPHRPERQRNAGPSGDAAEPDDESIQSADFLEASVVSLLEPRDDELLGAALGSEPDTSPDHSSARRGYSGLPTQSRGVLVASEQEILRHVRKWLNAICAS